MKKTRIPPGQVRFMNYLSGGGKVKGHFKRLVSRQLRRCAKRHARKELLDYRDELRDTYGKDSFIDFRF